MPYKDRHSPAAVACSRAYAKKYYHSHKERNTVASRKWYSEHPEALQEHRRRYYQKHRDRKMDYQLQYYENNKEAVNQKNRERWHRNATANKARKQAYYQEHREEVLEKTAKWQKEHPHHVRARQIRRRAKQAGCSRGEQRIITRWMVGSRTKPFMRCHWCGTKVSGSDIHFDHIVALTKGGTHSIGNLCISCSDCNHRKHARLLTDWVVGGQTFLSL